MLTQKFQPIKKLVLGIVLLTLASFSSLQAQNNFDLCGGQGSVFALNSLSGISGEFVSLFAFDLDSSIWDIPADSIMLTVTSSHAGDFNSVMPSNYQFNINPVQPNASEFYLYTVTIEGGGNFCTVELELEGYVCTSCDIEITTANAYCEDNSLTIELAVMDTIGTETSYDAYYQGILLGDSLLFDETYYFTIDTLTELTGAIFVNGSDGIICQDHVAIDEIDCVNTLCAIDSIILGDVECTEPNLYYISLDLDYNNTGSLGFNISPDASSPSFGGTGDYSYTDLPITIGPFSTEEVADYIINVEDSDNEGCSAQLILPEIGCLNPGEINGDSQGLVNNIDVLYLGLGYGATGPQRFNQSINDTDLAFIYWSETFNNDRNYGYADCNGDGVINTDDVFAIDVNYDFSTAESIPTSNTGSPMLWVDLPEENLFTGETVTVPISLGTYDLPANDIYGMAFSILYDSEFIEPGSMTIDFTGSMMGNANETISYAVVFEDEEQIDIAITRTDLMEISGYGDIGYASFVLVENIEGKQEIEVPISFEIANLTAISNSVASIAIDTPVDSGQLVSTVSNIEQSFIYDISPNPSSDFIQISNIESKNIDVELFNSNGQVFYKTQGEKNSIAIDVREFPSGIYFVILKNEDKIYSQRIMVQH